MSTTASQPTRTTNSASTPRAEQSPKLRGLVGSTVHQLRYDARSQVRNLAAVFFTIILPLLFMVVFTVTSDAPKQTAFYFVPAMMVLAAASGTLTNIAVTLAYLREYGQLKRVLTTPLPRSAFLGSRMIAGGVVSLLAVFALAIFGAVVFGAVPPTPATALVALTAIVGVLVIGSALGVAVAGLIRSETAAAPLANAVSLPLLLASGVFFPLDRAPGWFSDVAQWLPFTPAVEVATAAYDGVIEANAVLIFVVVSTAWTALAVAVAWKTFAWAPVRKR